MICASVQLPSPVSLSGVRFAELAVKAGFFSIGAMPASSMPGMSPVGPFGVWQLPQATIERIR